MEQFEFLRDLLIIYAVAGVVVFLFHRLHVPPIVGLLVAGVIVGPYGLSLVDDVPRVELLADIGVVLLLFTVGMEFTRERLRSMWRLLGAGVFQVAATIAGTAAVIYWQAQAWGPAIFAGFLIAHTSTTVMLKILLDRGEAASPHARISLAISIIQDLSVVWMFVLIPVLAGERGNWGELFRTLGLGVALVAGVLLAARYILPWVMFQVVRVRSRELFLILITVVCMGTAWLTAQAGLSLALGAFLAGVALAESEYSHQTLADAIPFRDIFVSLFFVSIGMLFDVRFVLEHPWWVLGAVTGVIGLKFVTGAAPALLLGYPWRVAVLVGVGMAQVGEFAFVLTRPGRELGLLPDDAYQALLATGIVTMALAPFLMRAAPALAAWGERQRWLPERIRIPQHDTDTSRPAALENHVIVAGYGFNGRNLARVLRQLEIPYIILELNPETVRAASAEGEPIVYGDCARPSVVEHAGVRHARVLVIALSDPASSRRAVQVARHLNREIHIVVRTRYLGEVDELQALGADEVIPEEFETSLEVFSRVLRRYEVPPDVALNLVADIRTGRYPLLPEGDGAAGAEAPEVQKERTAPPGEEGNTSSSRGSKG